MIVGAGRHQRCCRLGGCNSGDSSRDNDDSIADGDVDTDIDDTGNGNIVSVVIKHFSCTVHLLVLLILFVWGFV